MANTEPYKIAVLFRGDHDARRNATPGNNRYYRIFEELAALGIDAEPAVYSDDLVDEVRQLLLAVDGVLVWVDPIHEGQTRTGSVAISVLVSKSAATCGLGAILFPRGHTLSVSASSVG
jgi:hypothetical protein